MIINGVETEMNECIKNYVYLINDKTREVYYFNDDERLSVASQIKAINMIKRGELSGMRQMILSEGVIVWYPVVKLDEIERAAILDSLVRHGYEKSRYGCRFDRILKKVEKGRQTGSVKLEDYDPRKMWIPKRKSDPTRNLFDLNRFITKIDKPIMERDIDNTNTKSFDFIRLQMFTVTYESDPLEIIKKYKKEILELALEKIEKSRGFKHYGLPVNFLKLDKFTYCRSSNMIELLFVLKPIGGGLVELS